MSKTKLRIADEPADWDGAMTFEEIGKALGISKGLAWVTYSSAIRKLRRKRLAIRQLRELIRAKDDPGL